MPGKELDYAGIGIKVFLSIHLINKTVIRNKCEMIIVWIVSKVTISIAFSLINEGSFGFIPGASYPDFFP